MKPLTCIGKCYKLFFSTQYIMVNFVGFLSFFVVFCRFLFLFLIYIFFNNSTHLNTLYVTLDSYWKMLQTFFFNSIYYGEFCRFFVVFCRLLSIFVLVIDIHSF